MGDEIDVRRYLSVLMRWWWVVVSIFGISVGAAAVISLRQPDIYEARSKLLIVAPVSERVIADQPVLGTSLSVDTVSALASAKDLLQKIIISLNLRDPVDGRFWAVERLEKMLKPAVETAGQGTNRTTLPLLTMAVRGDDPGLVKRIAENWAERFIEQNAQLFVAESARSYEFIVAQFQETNEALNSLEQERQQLADDNPLPLLQDELDLRRDDLKQYLDNLLDTSVQLGLRREDYQDALDHISELSVNDRWIGFQIFDSASPAPAADTLEQQNVLQAKQFLFETQEAVNKARQSNDLKLVKATQEKERTLLDTNQSNDLRLLKFKEDNDLNLLNVRLIIQRDLLRNYIRQLEDAQNKLNVETRTLKALEAEINEQPQFLVLVKAIDDPALWQLLGLNPTIATWERVRELGLRTEEMNPAFVVLTDRIISTSVSLETERERINLLTKNLEETEKAVKALEKELGEKETIQHTRLREDLAFEFSRLEDDLALEFSRLNDELALEFSRLAARTGPMQTLYNKELEAYTSLLASTPGLRNEVRVLQLKEDQYQKLVSTYHGEWENVARRISLVDYQLRLLDRQTGVLQTISSALASRLQEARIAKAEESGSIRMVESAVEPQVPVGPNRRLNVMIGGVLGLLLGVIMAFVVNTLQSPQSTRQERQPPTSGEAGS